MANLTAFMEKYDSIVVEEDLANLDEEIADEVAVAKTLASDSAEKTAAVLQFIASSKETVEDQHQRMLAGITSLEEKIKLNLELESADAEYLAVVSSEEAQELANMLAELDAMSTSYHALLKKTGREGRVPQ